MARVAPKPEVTGYCAAQWPDFTPPLTHELTDNRRALLEAGAVDVLIDQNPQLEIEAALRAIAGAFGRFDPPPPKMITPVTIFTRENC